MDASKLADVVGALEPVELKGVELLRQARARSGEWFPMRNALPDGLTHDEITEATVQLIAYSRDTISMTRRASDVEPVPVDGQILEYGL